MGRPTEIPMSGAEVWAALMCDNVSHGSLIHVMLGALRTIPVEAFEAAIYRIQRETTIGPLLDPTAYLDGRQFDNAREFVDILRALRDVRQLLPAEEPK